MGGPRARAALSLWLVLGCGEPAPGAFEPVHRFVDAAVGAPRSATLDRDTRPVLPGQPFSPKHAAGVFRLEPEERGRWPRERRAVFESPAQPVPDPAWLEFAVGILPDAHGHGPAAFRLSLCEGDDCEEVHAETLDPAGPAGDLWHERRVALSAFAGRSVRFRFEVRHEQPEAAWFTLPVWGDPTLTTAREPAVSGPDFVLLSIDTLGARHLPTWGYERDTAPFIAALAERGTVFERCVAPATTTGPSHMTLFTSLPPTVHQVMGALERRLPSGVGTLAEALRRRGYATGASTGNGPLAASRGFARGFGSYVENTRDELHAEQGQVDVTFERGRAWLERKRGHRFFLFLHTFQVHDPYAPPVGYRSLWRGGEAPPDAKQARRLRGPARAREQRIRYDQEIRYVDDELAAFFRDLEQEGLWEHTVFVLISDHGEAFGQHGSGRHGPDPYEEVLHVPCLFVGPGIAEGLRVRTPVGLGDLMPTLLELSGAELPPGLTGQSLAPLLRGEAVPDALRERPVFAGAFSAGVLRRMPFPHLSVRVGERKLVRRQLGPQDYRFELYDLASDPGEQNDRFDAGDPEARELVALLEAFDAESLRRRNALDPGGPTGAEADPLDAEREARLRALGYLE
ncbi:MAG: sulfatase [Myxococcota bacterium]|nr:sulfatase [Myxococcota bacterium]